MTISPESLATIRRAAEQAHPRETGGLIIGYRIGSTVVVAHAVEVPDEAATSHAYTRREGPAQDALNLARARLGAPMGYVGDWHSHPASASPSRMDKSALRRTALQFKLPIGQVVIAHTENGYTGLFGTVAWGRQRNRLEEVPVVRASTEPLVPVTEEGGTTDD